MTEEEIAEGKRQLAHLCRRLGCSGQWVSCPGDPRCDILQRVGRSEWAARVIAEEELEISHSVVNGDGWRENGGIHTQEVPEYRDDHRKDTF